MKLPKPKLLVNNGKTPVKKLGILASRKPKSALLGTTKRNHKKNQLPEQAFAVPGFGDTGLTGES